MVDHCHLHEIDSLKEICSWKGLHLKVNINNSCAVAKITRRLD